MIKSLLIICTMIIALFGCSKDATSPEGLIKKFAIEMTKKKLDRDDFQKYTTGKMLEEIQQLNDEEFEKYKSLSFVHSPKVEILQKNCSDERCSLTYIIKYKLVQNSKPDFKTEVKKLATVVKVDNSWKVEEVSNLKTFHESVNPIEVMKESEEIDTPSN